MSQNPLEIQTFDNVPPLDDQFGVDPKTTAPDALYDSLFGQAEDQPPRQTYALLDAAKITMLPDMLEQSDLHYRCLFKGKAFDDLKTAAPWIVKLEDGNSFTRNLFTYDADNPAPWYLWDKNPGIYIRSTASLDDLWAHFRKFTKTHDGRDKWYYLRLYDPPVLKYYLEGIQASAERLADLFHLRSGVRIDALIATNAAEKTAHVFRFNPDAESTSQPVVELDIRYTEGVLREAIALLRNHTPELNHIPDDDLLWTARQHTNDFHRFDLQTKPVIANAIAIVALTGHPLTDLPPQDQHSLTDSNQSQFKRTTALLNRIKDRMTA
ncbi:DUF4123 domain-containing protein [Pseudaestuariivita rosea]|uniref:DUF4123 domain-containing protein n=1 Tax=Pseudaestuariivita rosea TaxID=2763263 RepID=UPI001ABBB58E|nr:DUF4123 domain-containing protein [Pseudaestuariivita rosea]